MRVVSTTDRKKKKKAREADAVRLAGEELTDFAAHS